MSYTFFDKPRLRIVTHGGYLDSGLGYAYKPHRDTWYSSPQSKINWWFPVFDLTPDRSLAFYPGYWSRPILNSSSQFNYDEWCSVGRKEAASQIVKDTRQHLLPLADMVEDDLRIACNESEMILFSAAHLHATAANTSGFTRFSIDFRIVHELDIVEHKGAPNLDNKSTGTTLGDFLNAKTLDTIPNNLINFAG